jgi:type I restriction enzyme, S subunit
MTVFRFDQIADNIRVPIMPADTELDRYVGLEHLDPESLKIRRWGNPSDVIGQKLRFWVGDIVYGRRRAYQRKLAVADFDGICSAHALVLRAKADVCLPEFLPFFLQSDLFHQRAMEISVGSLSPTINWGTLAVQEFPLPPVDEQRRIADLLWAADDAITEWQQTISKLEKLLAAVREDVLCSKNLPRKKLKTCVKNITAGKSVLGIGKPAAENEFGVLKVSAVGADGFVADENKVLEDNDTFIPAFSVHANDLLITRANTRELVGRVCKAPKEYPNLMLSDKTLRLEVDETLGDKDFLLQVLRSREARSQIEASASGTGGAMKNISQVQIMNFNLPLPELKIQKELAAKTNEVEKTLEQTRTHLGNSFELKKQLLNKMLS